MHKSGSLILFLAVMFLAACNNNQNAAETGESSDADTTRVAEQGETRGTETREMNPNLKKTQSVQQRSARKGNFRLDDNTGNVFSGEFAYMADAAYFINCSTDHRYSVVMQDAFPDLERKYLDVVGENAGSRVYIVVEGELQSPSPEEEGNKRGTLKVSKVLSVTADINCKNITPRMAGMFASFEGKATFTLCNSGTTYSILPEGAFKDVEAAYKDQIEEGKSIYVELYGMRKAIPAKKGGSRETGIVVTRVVGFDKGYVCE